MMELDRRTTCEKIFRWQCNLLLHMKEKERIKTTGGSIGEVERQKDKLIRGQHICCFSLIYTNFTNLVFNVYNTTEMLYFSIPPQSLNILNQSENKTEVTLFGTLGLLAS